MRIKNADFILLKNVLAYVKSCGRPDLSTALEELLNRLAEEQDKVREGNRKRAAANRRAGYRWPSCEKPETSKYYGDGGGKT